MSQEELNEKIETNLLALNSLDPEDTDGSETTIKGVVCDFYKRGKCPTCIGCLQPSDRLETCKKEYVERIPYRKLEVWDPSFYTVEKRVKKRFVEEESVLGLQCNSCYLADNCPEYKELASCAIDWSLDIGNTPKDMIAYLIKLQTERINLARTAELLDGGVPDQNLSNEMDRLAGLIAQQNEMMQNRFSLKIEANGSSSSAGGGILAKMFGVQTPAIAPQEDVKELPPQTTQTIDITPTEVTTEPIKNKVKKEEK